MVDHPLTSKGQNSTQLIHYSVQHVNWDGPNSIKNKSVITGAQPLWLEFQLVWWCYISETWEIWVLLTTLPLIIGVYSSYERGDIFSPRSTIYKFTHAYGCSRVASYENQWLSFEALVKYEIEQKFEMDFLFQIM